MYLDVFQLLGEFTCDFGFTYLMKRGMISLAGGFRTVGDAPFHIRSECTQCQFVVCIPQSRSNIVRLRAAIASVVLTCILLFLGFCFWPLLISDETQDGVFNASGLIIKADDPALWGDVMAVVIDPVDFRDQKSHNRDASDVEREFFQLLKQNAHQVLAENAVPIRAFTKDD